MAYPVTVKVEPQIENRNRMTVGFRLILAIPHVLLVGGIGLAASSMGFSSRESVGSHGGILGVAAGILAFVSWFTLVFAGKHIIGIRQFTTFYVRWRVRALAYLMLLEDAYPPFGDAAYPASVDVVDPPARDRLTIAFRIVLAIPHFFVVAILLVAWWFTAVFSWFAILFSGSYPEGLYTFAVGCLRWVTRVEAYMLLLVDDYPPFSLDD